MTVLNFVLTENAVHLVADTIVSDPADMAPISFTTKIHPAPHWQGLICGTGVADFVAEWYCTAITSIVAQDIRQLDEFAPDLLRDLFLKYREHDESAVASTIYHLGFDRAEDRFIGFAYRSAEDFVSEELDYGVRLTPDPEDPGLDVETVPRDLVAIAELQKLADETKPIDRRVGVGGHLICCAMRRVDHGGGERQVFTTIERCHAFADFPMAYAQACAKLPPDR